MLVSPCFETFLPFLVSPKGVSFMGHCDAGGPSNLWIVHWSPSVSPPTTHLCVPDHTHLCVPPTTHRVLSQHPPTSPTMSYRCFCDTFLLAALCSIHSIWLALLCFFHWPVPKLSKWIQKGRVDQFWHYTGQAGHCSKSDKIASWGKAARNHERVTCYLAMARKVK